MPERLVLGVLVAAAVVAVLVAASRRGRLFVAAAGLVGALAVAWILAAVAVRTDYRDADGFVDCWPYCSTFQNTVGATLVYGPLTAVLVLAIAALLVVLRRTRSGRR